MRLSRRDDRPRREPVAAQWRLWAQLLFVDAEGEEIGLDATLLDGFRGGLPEGTPFHLSARLPETSVVASVVTGVLSRWADDGRRVSIALQRDGGRLHLSDGTSRVVLELAG